MSIPVAESESTSSYVYDIPNVQTGKLPVIHT